MSEPLKDFRGKVTGITDVMLEAEQRATGKDKSEIAREVLDSWAKQRMHVAKIALALAGIEGIAGEGEGVTGSGRR